MEQYNLISILIWKTGP